MHEDQALIPLIISLLTDQKMPDSEAIAKAVSEYPDFQRLYEQIVAIRELSFSLDKIDLNKTVYSKGIVLSHLKGLQSKLKHLTWWAQRVTEGDYNQKVDYLGEFSEVFNKMTDTLSATSLQLEDLANFDSLTRIPNRLSLSKFLDASFKNCGFTQRPLFVLTYDIDYFKRVNDSFGHAAGDQVLVQFADILKVQFRSTDIFARYGGEEFVAVLLDAASENALAIGARTLRSIENNDFFLECGKVLKITVSVGVSGMRQGDESYEDIMKRSDEALYQAKGCGRNRVCFIR